MNNSSKKPSVRFAAKVTPQELWEFFQKKLKKNLKTMKMLI